MRGNVGFVVISLRRSTRALLPLMLAVPLAVGLLAGCGQGSPTDGGTPVTTPSSGSPSSEPPSASSPPSLGTPAPTAKAAALTVRGRVSSGVEAGCMILTAEQSGDTYQLVGGDRSVLRAGSRVEVSGVLQPGLMTTCQQGTPLVVQRARVV